MIKIVHIPNATYSEASQKSPLRWCVLDVKEDGTASGQHSWWRCKDFLNDSVIFMNLGKEFTMYGYPNSLHLNDGVGYVALKNIPDFFEENLGYLNEWLVERDMPPITVHEHDGSKGVEKVIGIDEYYWCSTFTISVITSLIRSCVYKKMVNDVTELFKEEPTLNGYMEKVDKQFTTKNTPMFKRLLFKNYQYDQTTKWDSHTVHNAGLQAWINSGVFNATT